MEKDELIKRTAAGKQDLLNLIRPSRCSLTAQSSPEVQIRSFQCKARCCKKLRFRELTLPLANKEMMIDIWSD